MNGYIEQKIIELQNSKTATEITQNAKYFINILAENERLTKQLETITFPMELQYGDLTNYIGYGQSETEKLVAISFGVLKEKGEYFGENKPNDESKVLFVAYFDRTESLEVLENIVNIGKARLKELQKED